MPRYFVTQLYTRTALLPHRNLSGNGDAAVDHNGLAGYVAAGLRGQKEGGTGDLVRLADAAERRLRVSSLQILRIFPQRTREVGANEARRDAIDAHVVRTELDRKIARELHVRRLGDAISADHRAAAKSSDRRDDDDRAVFAGDHLRRHHGDQPVVGDDVVVEDLAQLIVADGVHRPVVRVRCRIAHQHMNLPEGANGLVDQAGQCSLEEIFAAVAMARPAPYFALIASAASQHGSILRDETTTCAPCSAIRSTIARPIPREEPVTSATFPFRSNSDTVVPPPCCDVFCAPAYFRHRPAGKLKGSRAMTAINAVTDLTREGDIAVLTIDLPPVNAFSADVRNGLRDGAQQAAADPAVKAIVLICAGRTFIAGADISEFGKPSQGATLPEIQGALEGSPKPVIAAFHGTALGGGFESR